MLRSKSVSKKWPGILNVLRSIDKFVHSKFLTQGPQCLKVQKNGQKKRATYFATSLFNSFCSNVARQVARFLLPVFANLYVYVRKMFITKCSPVVSVYVELLVLRSVLSRNFCVV